MQEICSYGSVGVPAGNRRHYPEATGLESPVNPQAGSPPHFIRNDP